ncbi:membrane dipeptidase, partial [Mycobacterium tuberculosis]|nr:membrane dipeptidase [Mycobacterium tuberculosis]
MYTRQPYDRSAGPAPAVEHAAALDTTLAIAALLFRLERADALTICRSVADIRAAMAAEALAAVLHLDGAEATGPALAALGVPYAA